MCQGQNRLYILHGTAKKAEKAYFSIVQELHDGENGAKDVYAFQSIEATQIRCYRRSVAQAFMPHHASTSSSYG